MSKPGLPKKRERLETRLTSEQKALVQLAAAIEGRSVSDFMVTSAAQRAEEVIRSRQVLQLTMQDSLFFAQTVMNPAPPSETLRQAAHRRDELIES
jgi:uncharacterized protein (DUF1778 family)